jgi:hypothetical protein
MNNKILIGIIILMSFLIFGCVEESEKEIKIVSSQKEISKTTININDFIEEKELPNSIVLPISKDDARFLASYCPECVSGDMYSEEGFWIIRQGEEYPICSTKIEIKTGKVFCELYG